MQLGFRQLAIALILLGMVVGSAVVAMSPNPTTWTWLPNVMMGLFVFAMFLSGMWVVGLMFGYFKQE
jgi:flagellar biosynthesis protein FliQ